MSCLNVMNMTWVMIITNAVSVKYAEMKDVLNWRNICAN